MSATPQHGYVMPDEELAPILGVSTSTLRHWRARGEGPPYFKLGDRLVRYRWSEVEEWLSDSRQVPA